MKLYPFSTAKHAHDIEFRRNRLKNEIYDVESGELIVSNEVFDKMCELEERLTKLLETVLFGGNGRVCYLTGEEIALAKETVLWATEERGAKR